MFLTMGSLGDWISLTGERISTTSELGVAHISPRGGRLPPERRSLRPPAPGAAPLPPAVPSALWGGTPLLLTSRERRQAIGGKRVCKTMGKRPRSERRRRGSLGLAGGQPAGLSTGHPEGGARGRESPRPGIQPSGRSPASLGVEDPRPPQGLTSLQQGIVSTPFP